MSDMEMDDIEDEARLFISRNYTPRTRVEKSKHTEIEKKRRAFLRECLDRLKEVVPLDRDVPRFTIHRLLVKSQQYIKTLERRHGEYRLQLRGLESRNQMLKRRVCELEKTTNFPSVATSQNPHATDSKLQTTKALSPLKVKVDLPRTIKVLGNTKENFQPRVLPLNHYQQLTAPPRKKFLTVKIHKRFPSSLPHMMASVVVPRSHHSVESGESSSSSVSSSAVCTTAQS